MQLLYKIHNNIIKIEFILIDFQYINYMCVFSDKTHLGVHMHHT